MPTDNQKKMFRSLMVDKVIEPKDGKTKGDLIQEFDSLPFTEASRWIDRAQSLDDRDSGAPAPF